MDKKTGKRTEDVLKNDVEVTLGEFQVTEGKYNTKDTKLVVTVKNITLEKKSYHLQIEAVSQDGNRITSDYVYANNLNAGQTQSFDVFEYVTDQLDLMMNATFKIVQASVS